MPTNHYAIEITTDATTVTNATYGIAAGVFRFITDRPGYTGSPTYPKWEDTSDNTYAWYEGIISKDGLGNPNRNVNLDISGEYGTMSGFQFSITNALLFWDFLHDNSIYLTNRSVKVYAVIGDVFYQIWDGVVQETSYSETNFKFTCIDKFTAIHKQLPPTLLTDPEATGKGDPIPVVFGDVAYSKIIIDKSYDTEYQSLWIDPVTGTVHDRTAAQLAITPPSHDNAYKLWLENATSSPVVASRDRALDEHIVGTTTTATASVSTADGATGKIIHSWLTDSFVDDTLTQYFEGIADYDMAHDWTFKFWASVDSLADPVTVVFDIFKRNTISNAEILLFTTAATTIDSVTAKAFSVTYTQATGFKITDPAQSITTRYRSRVSIRPRAIQNTSATARTFTMYYDGPDYETTIETPYPKWPGRQMVITLYVPGSLTINKNQFVGMYLFAVAGGGSSADAGYRITYNSASTQKPSGMRYINVSIDRTIEGFHETDGYFNDANVLPWVWAPYITAIDSNTTIFRIGKVTKIGYVSESNIDALVIDPATNLPYLYSYESGTKSYLSIEASITAFDNTTDNDYGHPYVQLLPGKENIIPLVPRIKYVTMFGHDVQLGGWTDEDFAKYDSYAGSGSDPVRDIYSYGPSNTNGDTFKYLTDLDKVTEFVLPVTSMNWKCLTLKFAFDINDYLDMYDSLSKLYIGFDGYLYGVENPIITGISGPNPDGDILVGVSRCFRVKDFFGNMVTVDDSFFNSLDTTIVGNNNIKNLAYDYSPHIRANTMLASREWAGICQTLPIQYYLAGNDHNTDSGFSGFSAKWSLIPDDIFAFIKSGVCSGYVECYISFNIFQYGTWNTYYNAGVRMAVKQFGLLATKKTDYNSDAVYARVQGESNGALYTNNVYHIFKRILEDYDKIPAAQIDYTNLPTKRLDWIASRTITDRTSSLDYLNDLAKQSYVAICPTRTGKRRLVAFRDYTDSPVTHDENIILRDSAAGLESTPISNLYNNFKLVYSTNPATGEYDRTLYIDRIWASAFPAADAEEYDTELDTYVTWKDYVGGVDWITYADAKTLWTVCHESYLNHKCITDALPSDLSELKWYFDPTIFDPDATIGCGMDSSAYKFLQNLVEWTTRQKEKVSYSLPLTTTHLSLELCSPIIFNDDILTDHANRTGWITGIELDLNNDKINIQATLEPYNIGSVLDGMIIESGDRTTTIDESGVETDTKVEGGVL